MIVNICVSIDEEILYNFLWSKGRFRGHYEETGLVEVGVKERVTSRFKLNEKRRDVDGGG